MDAALYGKKKRQDVLKYHPTASVFVTAASPVPLGMHPTLKVAASLLDETVFLVYNHLSRFLPFVGGIGAAREDDARGSKVDTAAFESRPRLGQDSREKATVLEMLSRQTWRLFIYYGK